MTGGRVTLLLIALAALPAAGCGADVAYTRAPDRRVEVGQLVDTLGQVGRAPRQRGADRVRVAADEPEVQHRPGRYLLPAYLERKAATSVASFPTTMFSGMIAPEKPPLRSA